MLKLPTAVLSPLHAIVRDFPHHDTFTLIFLAFPMCATQPAIFCHVFSYRILKTARPSSRSEPSAHESRQEHHHAQMDVRVTAAYTNTHDAVPRDAESVHVHTSTVCRPLPLRQGWTMELPPHVGEQGQQRDDSLHNMTMMTRFVRGLDPGRKRTEQSPCDTTDATEECLPITRDANGNVERTLPARILSRPVSLWLTTCQSHDLLCVISHFHEEVFGDSRPIQPRNDANFRYPRWR